jgi:hypothetical protein
MATRAPPLRRKFETIRGNAMEPPCNATLAVLASWHVFIACTCLCSGAGRSYPPHSTAQSIAIARERDSRRERDVSMKLHAGIGLKLVCVCRVRQTSHQKLRIRTVNARADAHRRLELGAPLPARAKAFLRINSNSIQHTTQRTRIKADSDPAMTPPQQTRLSDEAVQAASPMLHSAALRAVRPCSTGPLPAHLCGLRSP